MQNKKVKWLSVFSKTAPGRQRVMMNMKKLIDSQIPFFKYLTKNGYATYPIADFPNF